MQARRRRRNAAILATVNSLISLSLSCELSDIWRQRQLSQLFQNPSDCLRKACPALSPLAFRDDLCLHRTAIQFHSGARAQTPPPHQATPLSALFIQLPQQEYLNRPACRFMRSQPRRNDAAVVRHQEVAPAQEPANLAETAVFNSPRSHGPAPATGYCLAAPQDAEL